MFEYVSIFTRPDRGVEFHATSLDVALRTLHATHQCNMLKAKGLVGLFNTMSAEGLTLQIISVWESAEDSTAFDYDERSSYFEMLAAHNTLNKIAVSTRSCYVPDTDEVKLKKIRNRLTASAAGLELQKFIDV
jgi:hypothetical protein